VAGIIAGGTAWQIAHADVLYVLLVLTFVAAAILLWDEWGPD